MLLTGKSPKSISYLIDWSLPHKHCFICWGILDTLVFILWPYLLTSVPSQSYSPSLSNTIIYRLTSSDWECDDARVDNRLVQQKLQRKKILINFTASKYHKEKKHYKSNKKSLSTECETREDFPHKAKFLLLIPFLMLFVFV